jgi:hypothetical protein
MYLTTVCPCASFQLHPKAKHTAKTQKKKMKKKTGSGLSQSGRAVIINYPPITYYWTGILILDHSYVVGNLINSKIAETKALEPLNPDTFVSAIF